MINLFQKGSDLVFRIRGDNTLGLSLVKAPGVLITNTWIHVTGVRDISSGQIRIYVNGVLKGTAADGTSGTSTFTFRIGAHSSEQLHWNGLIDEVEVFDRALSASEIQSIFNAGSAGKCKGIEQLIDELQAIVDADPGTPLADKLEDALASVQTALDELNKEPPDNQAAVGNMEGAVGSICDAVVEEGLDPVQGTQLMDKLAGVARQLAVEAIDAAVAAGGDQDAIDEAEVSLIVGSTSGTSRDSTRSMTMVIICRLAPWCVMPTPRRTMR